MNTHYKLKGTGLRLLVVLIILAISTCSTETDISAPFVDRGVVGTMLVESLDGKQQFVHNPDRINQRFIPASTFKIPHTLIALAERAVADENDVIPWNGKQHFIQAWNRDHNLRSAFPVSCVWFYQEIAKRLDDETYKMHLRLLGYGNMRTGPNLTTFWLEGDTRISARQQVDLLKQLYDNALPFESDHQDLLKSLMVLEQKEDYTIRGKTGWGIADGSHLGWFVGYVETTSDTWFFAMNMDGASINDSHHRQQITHSILQTLEILPGPPGGSD